MQGGRLLGESLVTRVTKMTIPERRHGAGDREWVAEGRCRGYRDPELLHLAIMFRVSRSFTKQADGSNSTKQWLLMVN
jgi:hypothetical protein